MADLAYKIAAKHTGWRYVTEAFAYTGYVVTHTIFAAESHSLVKQNYSLFKNDCVEIYPCIAVTTADFFANQQAFSVVFEFKVIDFCVAQPTPDRF